MKSIIFPKIRHYFETIGSTQDAARAAVEADGLVVAGHVFATAEQTAGRGRRGHTWFTPPGANLCQTLIGGEVPLAEMWQLPFVVGIAAHEAIARQDSNLDVRLRFPNDVQVGGKKAAGILIETAVGPGVTPDCAMPLIGIGINVLGDVSEFPADVAVRATTLESAMRGVSVSVAQVEEQLYAALTDRWNDWRSEGGWERALSDWNRVLDGGRRGFTFDGALVSCRVVSMREDGRAVLELPDGERRMLPVVGMVLG